MVLLTVYFCLQALPESLDPDSVLDNEWAQPAQREVWALPQGLDPSLEAFRTWLRHLLWELTRLLVQVSLCPHLPVPILALMSLTRQMLLTDIMHDLPHLALT